MCGKYSIDKKNYKGEGNIWGNMVLMLTVERFFKSDALGETVSKVILFILFKICVKYIVLNMDFE